MTTTNTSAKAVAVAPAADLKQSLAGADFADAFEIALPPGSQTCSAHALAQQMFGRTPGWIQTLMRVRNAIVGKLGLKQVGMHIQPLARDAISGFPVMSNSENQVLLGFDDHHLDFRIWVQRTEAGGSVPQRLTVTTVVRTNKLLGRAYMFVVRPIHKCIVPTMLNRLRSH
ncbi:DUF2867 domain-containing protein [Herbaspirillum autotrophicum]|uniref:DUF2867 domain-containing protein n=1 Tax=Herbaspirillum autotrophicum TaxID=180195 RepID=UPI00067BDB95|nr:DUF2867 domain-containing protein [Herbaspirillum autotrophicum]